MKRVKPCLVCGQENPYTEYYEDGWGVVEEHYFCNNCTYFIEMAYCEPIEGVIADFPTEYKERIEELHLKVYPQNCLPF